MALNCACVGNSKAPLGVISFAENATMAVMGAVLIFLATSAREIETQVVQPAPIALVVEPQESD